MNLFLKWTKEMSAEFHMCAKFSKTAVGSSVTGSLSETILTGTLETGDCDSFEKLLLLLQNITGKYCKNIKLQQIANLSTHYVCIFLFLTSQHTSSVERTGK